MSHRYLLTLLTVQLHNDHDKFRKINNIQNREYVLYDERYHQFLNTSLRGLNTLGLSIC